MHNPIRSIFTDDNEPLPKSKVLWEEDTWQIKTYPYPNEWNSLIMHKCLRPSGFGREMIPMWRTPKSILEDYSDCPRCADPIPEGLFGLWKLHNFDKIQTYYECQTKR